MGRRTRKRVQKRRKPVSIEAVKIFRDTESDLSFSKGSSSSNSDSNESELSIVPVPLPPIKGNRNATSDADRATGTSEEKKPPIECPKPETSKPTIIEPGRSREWMEKGRVACPFTREFLFNVRNDIVKVKLTVHPGK